MKNVRVGWTSGALVLASVLASGPVFAYSNGIQDRTGYNGNYCSFCHNGPDPNSRTDLVIRDPDTNQPIAAPYAGITPTKTYPVEFKVCTTAAFNAGYNVGVFGAGGGGTLAIPNGGRGVLVPGNKQVKHNAANRIASTASQAGDPAGCTQTVTVSLLWTPPVLAQNAADLNVKLAGGFNWAVSQKTSVLTKDVGTLPGACTTAAPNECGRVIPVEPLPCVDGDNDGYLPAACYANPNNGGGDCDDTNAAVRPGGTEVCNNVDDDCDGTPDDGLGTPAYYYPDNDRDTYGAVGSQSTLICGNPPAGYSLNNTDCNDNNAAIKPNGTELCNGVDDDCDGTPDDGLGGVANYYPDADLDGHGAVGSQSVLLCGAPPNGYSEEADDCADNDPNVYPGAQELCDAIDNNCNFQADEGLGTPGYYYPDVDQDGYGAAGSNQVRLCGTPPPGYDDQNTDCNDNNNAIRPGVIEVCDGVDNNCNNEVDEGFAPPAPYYPDGDLDGYGDATANATVYCGTPPPGWVATNTDCNDDVSTIYPGAQEYCDGVDNNCVGGVDEPFLVTSVGGYDRRVGEACDDVDDPDVCELGTVQCVSLTAADCVNDVARAETCNNQDDDCDGDTDEDFSIAGPNGTTLAVGDACDDNDEDYCPYGHVECTSATSAACVGDLPTPEVCDGYNEDNDCDGVYDVNDGFPLLGTACGEAVGNCVGGIYQCNANGDGVVCVTQEQGTEFCGNNVDDDCDGLTDEDNTWYGAAIGGACDRRTDNDYCANGVVVCNAQGVVDCEETVETPEICGTLIDEDCDGETDETFERWNGLNVGERCDRLTDRDRCAVGFVLCDDGVVDCYGDFESPEVCGNNEDDDCDGLADEACGQPLPDAGTPGTPDAGTPDSGRPDARGPDAAVTVDAAQPDPEDAGQSDAAVTPTPDAGNTPDDAGRNRPDRGGWNNNDDDTGGDDGGGSCTCATPADSPVGAWAVMAVAMLGMVTRRRRR
ncbi:MAG: putative metal-binding motif-containing protein [Myxococcota bacterium]